MTKNKAILIAAVIIATGCGPNPDDPRFQEAVVKAIEARKEEIFQIMSREAQESQGRSREMARQQELKEREEQFVNPLQPELAGRFFTGPANAPITMVEYSDYECPYCKKGAETVKILMDLYPGQIRWVFKHLPLPIHKNAIAAARGSIAAERQGKFRQYHDILFSNQDKISELFVINTARGIGLDMGKFMDDYRSGNVEAMIREDMNEAQRFGISGTPGYIINGVIIRGAQQMPEFRKIIDRHLSGKQAPR